MFRKCIYIFIIAFLSSIITITAKNEIKILKLGGNVITEKGAQKRVTKTNCIKQIVKEIATYNGKLILVHGAGSFGHPLAKKYNLHKAFDAQGTVITHNSVRTLNQILIKALCKEGINAIGIEPMSCVICKNGRIVKMLIDTIKLLLDNNFVPILFGDMVMDLDKKTCILSGDQIITYLAQALDIHIIGCSSSEKGVYDQHGKIIKKISSENFDTFKKSIGESTYTDVTGGMLGKVTELLCIPGITSYIFDATQEGNITKFLHGKAIGTKIIA